MMSHEEVASFVETQLAVWPLAKKNYDALATVRRREVRVDDFSMGVQWNPARAVSTGADVNKEAIAKRGCFLCRNRRPGQQLIIDIVPGWDILVNPYPILPIHLTIVAATHRPQDRVPEEIVTFAENLPAMAVFFNGAKAGASAPDHLHLQAVLKDELPLLRLIEAEHPSGKPGIMSSNEFKSRVPYLVFSGVVAPGEGGMKTLLAGLRLGGVSSDGTFTDTELVNTFFWIGNDGLLRFAVVPRRAHRPKCYSTEKNRGRLISPGCIDMAGLIITPREEDFKTLSEKEILQIYSEVAVAI